MTTSRPPTEVEPLIPASTIAPAPPALEPEEPPPPGRRFRTFTSLIEVPAFRWYLLGMTGNWSAMQMQQLARGWLAYDLTGSYAALGGIELANSLPRILLGVSGGVVADRAARRHVMQAGQVFQACLAIAIATLLFTGLLRFEHLLIAATLQGVANSFTMPARQSMIPEIVGPDRLMNAIGLQVFSMNTMRLGAPALAGVLIAAAGAGWVFALMACLYVLAIVTMFRVPAVTRSARLAAAGATASSTGRGGRARPDRFGLRDIGEAFVYLRHNRVLWMLLAVHGFLSVLSVPYQRLLPGFVTDYLSGDESQAAVRIGTLLTFTAIGALLGSLTIASLPNKNRGKLLIGSMVIFGVALLAFANAKVFVLSLPIVLILGIGQSGRQSLNNILIQSHVDDQYRGRISSVMLLEDGVESLGVFGIALVAAAFGAQVALTAVACGLIILAGILWFVTPAYRRLD